MAVDVKREGGCWRVSYKKFVFGSDCLLSGEIEKKCIQEKGREFQVGEFEDVTRRLEREHTDVLHDLKDCCVKDKRSYQTNQSKNDDMLNMLMTYLLPQ